MGSGAQPELGPCPRGRALIGPGTIATGDLFEIDEAGYLYFQGRISDFVVLRGEKVSLFAVRQFVQGLPGVARCATVVSTDADGNAHYDLQVQVTGVEDSTEDMAAAERRIRHEANTFLLPGERPRDIVVETGDPAAFRK